MCKKKILGQNSGMGRDWGLKEFRKNWALIWHLMGVNLKIRILIFRVLITFCSSILKMIIGI